MTVSGSGRVGFNNVVAPGERLELNGDMRLRWGASLAEGPGIWLGTSTTSPEPWFVGMVSNADVGMYYTGANAGPRLYWNLASGSMGVNGDVGANGWQLVSAGANGATYWKAPQYYTEFNTLSQEVFEPTAFTITTNNTWQQMTGLAITQNYTRPTKVEAYFNVLASAPYCCGHVEFMVVIDIDGGGQKQFRYYVENGNSNTFNGSMMLSIPAGQHKVSIAVLKINGPDLVLPNTQGVQSSLILQAIPG